MTQPHWLTNRRFCVAALLLISASLVLHHPALADPEPQPGSDAPTASHSLADLVAAMAELPPLPTIARDALWIGPEDYRARRDALAERLEADNGVMLMRAYRDHNELAEIGPERQDNDSLYLTGCDLLQGQNPGAWLIISPEQTRLVLPDGLDRATGATMLREAIARGGFAFGQVVVASALDATLREMLAGVGQVFMQHAVSEEMEFATRGRQRALRFTALADRVRRTAAASGNDALTIPDTPGTSCTHRIMALRAVKSPAEIARLREAATITAQALRETLRITRAGMYEGDLCSLLRLQYREHGAPNVAFGPIVGAARNSLVLHYQPRRGERAAEIHAGDIVVIDNGAEYLGYAADYTRTVAVGANTGMFTDEQKSQVQAVLDSHLAALELAAPGVTIVELHRRSVAALAETYPGKDTRRLYPHLVGHHVGMHVHDPVDFRAPLQPGHVFTIEPGWYDPESGIGVRIEDTYLVREDGTIERITRNDLVPFEPEKLEQLVGSGLMEWRGILGVQTRFAWVADPEVPEIQRPAMEVVFLWPSRWRLDLREGDRILAVNDIGVLATEALFATRAVFERLHSVTVVRSGLRTRLLPGGQTVKASEGRLCMSLEALDKPELQHRPPGTNVAAFTAGWICRQLADLKCTPADGHASFVARRELADGTRTPELAAMVPATETTDGTPLMIVVPYDSPRPADLADDVPWGCPDNAAIATALEVARLLSTQPHPPVQLRFVSWTDARRAAFAEEHAASDSPQWRVVQLNQLCPGGRLEHRVGHAGLGTDAMRTVRATIEAQLHGCQVEFAPGVMPFVGPESRLNADTAQWLDITLPPPPGQPVRAFKLSVDSLTPLSRVAHLVERLVLSEWK